LVIGNNDLNGTLPKELFDVDSGNKLEMLKILSLCKFFKVLLLPIHNPYHFNSKERLSETLCITFLDGNNFSGGIPSGIFKIATLTNISLGTFDILQ